jgi:hypothetical protein
MTTAAAKVFLTVGKRATFRIKILLSLGAENGYLFSGATAEARLGNQEFSSVQSKSGWWLKTGVRVLHKSLPEFVAIKNDQ